MVSSNVVFLWSMLSQAGHLLCSKQDIPCVPGRTRLRNREDGSDFHDFLTKSIESPRTFFLKIFAAPKNFSCRRFRRCRRRRRRRRRSVNHTSYLQHCIDYGSCHQICITPSISHCAVVAYRVYITPLTSRLRFCITPSILHRTIDSASCHWFHITRSILHHAMP